MLCRLHKDLRGKSAGVGYFDEIRGAWFVGGAQKNWAVILHRPAKPSKKLGSCPLRSNLRSIPRMLDTLFSPLFCTLIITRLLDFVNTFFKKMPPKGLPLGGLRSVFQFTPAAVSSQSTGLVE